MTLRTLLALTVIAFAQPYTAGAQTLVSTKCDCAVFPWKPEPCVKECTARIVMVPGDFERLLKPTPELASSVRALKAQGASYEVTFGKIDGFLASPPGAAFLETVEAAKPSDLKMLVQASAKVKGPG